MAVRASMARILIRLGRLIQSLALMVMRPDDLVEFGRRTYARTRNVDLWSSRELVDAGLGEEEKDLVENLPVKNGRLLLLGVGGGREAIPLARMGFQVTGVDFVADMVEKAKANAVRHGIQIEGAVQDISRLEFPAGFFDVVFLSAAMYSCVPTRAKRVAMLRRISEILRPGGCLACQFHLDPNFRVNPRAEFLGKTFAFLTLGNLPYERGDTLWGEVEFLHVFPSESALRDEFAAAGFEVRKILIPERDPRGGAILVKA